VALCAPPATAQTSLGIVSTPVQLTACPALPQNTSFDASMTCFSANISNCPNTDEIGIIYGVSTPAGQLGGTIVMLSGDGGAYLPESFEEYIPASVSVPTYEKYTGYLGSQLPAQMPYQVIEAVWGVLSGTPPNTTFTGEDWEYTNTQSGNNALSIINAACRPATFLNWVRNGNCNPICSVGGGIWAGSQGQTGTFGMCAHVNSGGAGAAANSLAWYNAGAAGAPQWGSGYLDKVVMENGPVFSDIEQGCEMTNGVNSQTTTICNQTPPPHQNYSWEPGCASSTWPQGSAGTNYSLEYNDGDQSNVSEWTQDVTSISYPACGSTNPHSTSGSSLNATWYNQSIVCLSSEGCTLTQQPSLGYYQNTAMSGWLCQNVLPGPKPQNNSAPEGQLFFYQFQNPSQVLSVNAVSNCPSVEAIEGGNVSYGGNSYGPGSSPPKASAEAIVLDMTQGSSSCFAMGRLRAQQ
jgi:hypothetical protein